MNHKTKNINKQKQIERQIKEINERAFKYALKRKKNMALFIDPVPNNFLTKR